MNPVFAALEPSLIREINALKRPGDLDLGLGEPVLPPDPEPFRKAAEWVAQNGCPYTHNLGSDELREAVGTYLKVPKDEVCITHGSQEALYLAFRTALDPENDEALIVEPCYPAYPKICQMEGIRYRTVTLENTFAPDAGTVLKHVTGRTKLIVLSTPCNPTGRIWPRAELEKLKSSGIRILSDEVYRELSYTEFTSALEVQKEALVAGGLSKSHALTGLRIGWLRAPLELMPAVHRCHQLMTTAASTFSQRVALEVLKTPTTQLPAYQERRERLLQSLGSLEVIEPEGAFYLMVKCPRDSLATAKHLLEEHRVVTVPGVAFGAEGWLRLSWAGDPDTVKEGLRKVSQAFQRML